MVLIDSLTGVRSSARPRVAPTFTFCHIGLTDALIYIKPRRFYFFLFLSGSFPTLRRLTTVPRSRLRRVLQHRRAISCHHSSPSAAATPSCAAVAPSCAAATATSSVHRAPTLAAASPPCHRSRPRHHHSSPLLAPPLHHRRPTTVLTQRRPVTTTTCHLSLAATPTLLCRRTFSCCRRRFVQLAPSCRTLAEWCQSWIVPEKGSIPSADSSVS
jgi:hypothetical protein